MDSAKPRDGKTKGQGTTVGTATQDSLHSALEVRNRRLSVLNALLHIGLEDVQLEVQLSRALDEILSIPWLPLEPKGGIFLTDATGRTLRLTTQKKLAPALQEVCAEVPFGRCLCGRAASNRSIVHAPCVDDRHENHYAGMVPHGHYSIPILSGDNVLGVIVLYLPDGHVSSEDETEFLESVANTLASAVERKQAEAALQESEARSKDFAETAADWFWETDPDLRFTHIAGRYEGVLRLTREQILGKRPRDLFAEGKERNTEWERHFPVRDAGRPSDEAHITSWFEMPWRRADNGIVTLRVSGVPFNTAAGAFAGYRGTVRDVTERVATMDALRKLSRAVEQSPNLILITDTEGIIEYVNPTFCFVTGYQSEEIIGQRPSVLQSGQTPTEVYTELWQTITAGDTWEGELLNRKKDGSLFLNTVAISPITNEEGRVSHFLSIQTDITARRAAEEQVRRHREELARVTRIISMGETATALAHELNQPLSAIVSFADGAVRRLRDKPEDLVEVVEALEETVMLAKHASEVVQSIRAFLHPQDDQTEPLNINAVVQQAEVVLRSRLERNRTRVEFKLTDNLPAVEGTFVQLEQVLVNLMSNAIEAMQHTDPEERALCVTTLENAEGQIEVSVIDHGVGLSPETEERMFDTFFTTKPDGLGMGLSMCRTIAESHGGRLWLTRNPERGVTFHLGLPAARNV